MTNHPNYREIDPPVNSPPEDYSYRERRAEILNYIIRAGGPENITQARLAERYAVSEGQISQDVGRLGDYVGEHLGDDVRLSLYALRGRLVAELLDEDDWRAKVRAWDIAVEYAEWAGVVPADESAETRDGLTPEAGGIEVDDDGHVTTELDEKAKENIDKLHEDARRAITATRIDEQGDDLSAEDVGLTDD